MKKKFVRYIFLSTDMGLREQSAKQSSVVHVKAGEGKSWKRAVNRAERRKAKVNPDCVPTYKLYRGYLS